MLGTIKVPTIFCVGVNQFSDLTQAEFEAGHMGGYKPSPSSSAVNSKRSAFASTYNITRQLPESVDWREKVSSDWSPDLNTHL